MITLGMIEGKENLCSIQTLTKSIFANYDRKRKFNIACGKNEYVESEGVFPNRLKKLKNRHCTLCDKYKLSDSRQLFPNPQNTREILVHPDMEVHIVGGADEKNVGLQFNVSSGYCLHCKVCIGQKGDEGGWVAALNNGTIYEERTFEEMLEASKEWGTVYQTFEENLERGRVQIPEGMAEPTTATAKHNLFKTTQEYKDYKLKYPEYRGELPHNHLRPEHIMHDIALHGKIHFGAIMYSLCVVPLIEYLEQHHEGHSVQQYVCGMEDTGMPHKAKILLEVAAKSGVPKSRKEKLVEGVKTATYVSFLSTSSRTKKDLERRVENIVHKDAMLQKAHAPPESRIQQDILEKCKRLLSSKPSKDILLEFLTEIVQNRQSAKYFSAFSGGVFSMEEIEKMNTARALNAAIEKLSPGSIEHATLSHTKEIIQATNTFNGRDTNKYLKKTVPCLIKYLDFNLYDRQQHISEQMQFTAQQLRQSQSDLQANNKQFSEAISCLMEYLEHPSQQQKCPKTIDALTEAVEYAEEEQRELLSKAIELAESMQRLYGDRPLGSVAQECMDNYVLLMEILNTFLFPFEVAKDVPSLTELTKLHTPKMKLLAERLASSQLNLNTHPRSLYMHLLAFHVEQFQLDSLAKYQRPLASFALEKCEAENKVTKKYGQSMFSFTHRPVGNSKYSTGPQWRNKAGYRMQKGRIAQLFYPFYLGNQRDPYRCSSCKQYGHNSDSSDCPSKLIAPSA